MLAPMLTLATIVAFVAAAVGLGWVRGQRTRRVLTEARPLPPPMERPVEAPPPNVAARLFAPASKPEPILPLLRDPAFDPYAFGAVLRADFERVLLGSPPEQVDYTDAVAETVTRRAPVLVLAIAPPRLAHAFADERWASVQVTLEALVQAEAAAPRRWVETWAVRQAKNADRWEITQVIDGQLRSVGEATPILGSHGRFSPPPAGKELAIDTMQRYLDAAVRALDGAEDPLLHPLFAAEAAWIGEVQRLHGRQLPKQAELTAARELEPGREGMARVRRVWVEGLLGDTRFREVWVLVHDEAWRLGAAR